MGKALFKIPHECGTKDGCQVFEQDDGTVDAYCYSCSTYNPNPLGEHTLESFPIKRRLTKTPEEVAQELLDIGQWGCQDLPSRRLRRDSLEAYGVKIGVSEEDGSTPKLAAFPFTSKGKVTGYKMKLLEKKRMWSIGEMKEVDLFGWEQAKSSGARRLIITEGEWDAVALTRIFEMHTKEQYKDNIPAVVSLPHGVSSAGKDLARVSGQIRKHFKEVSFCFDNDEAGERAVEEAVKVLPEATVINLPVKDANDAILEGKTKAAYKAAYWEPAKPQTTSLVWGETLHEEAREPAQWGYSWPWDHINSATRGIRLGETIYIGAGVKLGKSELVNALAAHFIKEHGWKVFLAKPEEANNKTYKMLAGKMVGRIFHDPTIEFDYDAYDEAGRLLKGKLAMLNIYQDLKWETLKNDIRSAAHAGCKAIFLDPITQLTNGMNAADANTKLQEIAQSLSVLAKDLDIVILIFAHLRNPESGPPHERGGKVLSSQFAGSRAMARSCNLMIGLEGNKDPELEPEERNIRVLDILEDREFGVTGRFPLYWNPTNGMFTEMKSER